MSKKLKLPEYLEKPTCVYTGLPWEIFELDGGTRWFARVCSPYGVITTSLFQTKDQLLVFLSSRNGIRPDSPYRIEVREPKVSTASEDAEIRKEERDRNEEAIDFVARVAVDGPARK